MQGRGCRQSKKCLKDWQKRSIWALSLVFGKRTDIVISGEAFSGEEALEKIPLSQPDVVVMDAEMPGMGGPAATAEIRKRFPSTRVLAYSAHRRAAPREPDEKARRALARGSCAPRRPGGYVPGLSSEPGATNPKNSAQSIGYPLGPAVVCFDFTGAARAANAEMKKR